MDIEFDATKDRANQAKHGVSLARADYGEPRLIGFGLLDGVAHCLAFTLREGRVRVISLRRSHRREFQRYVDID